MMDKILDQLLMPPPTSTGLQLGISQFNSQESPKNLSGLSLDRSHNSSSTTNSSSNSSWLSESSCGCHSPRTNSNKSSLVFYRKSILPPMLCSASRSEMQTYKNKAIEKEQKRKMKSKRNLLSRVEAILSSVDINTQSTEEITDDIEAEQKNNTTESPKSITEPETVPELQDIDPIVSENFESSVTSTQPEEQKSSNCSQNNSETMATEESTNSSSTPSSDEEDDNFREDAYRRSLQNLLQKSMNESLNNSTVTETTETTTIVNKVTSSASSSVETNNWAENTLATVVPNNNTSSSIATTTHDDDLISETTTASFLVDSILDEVRKELSLYSTQHIPIQTSNILDTNEQSLSEHSSHKSCDLSQSTVVLPQPQVPTDYQKLPLLTTNNQSTIKPSENNQSSPINVQDSENQSASDDQPNILSQNFHLSATDHINDALNLINTKLTCNSPRDNTPLSHHSTSYDATMGSFHDMSMTSVTPETNNLMQSYKNVLEKQENEQNSENIKDSPEVFSSDDPTKSTESSKEKSGRKGERVRSNSYSIEAPSPLLVSSRDSHTISSVQADTDNCSDTTSLFSHEVKRRLEMPSDSEESSVSSRNKQYDITRSRSYDITNNNSQSISNELSGDYYKKIEEHHRKELMELQLQHEKQLSQLKQQLVQGEPALESSIETIESMSFNDLNKIKKSSKNQVMDKEMHLKWCKLSALIKGYLTRRLLRARPVQNIMKTIRDTSKTILSIKSEGDSNTKPDATLLRRLFLQLEAALYEFHETFFDTTVQERISIIARSQLAESKEKNRLKQESSTVIPQQRLSAATLKSMERKRLERKSHTMTNKVPQKDVKSKISYIWKDDKPKKKLNKPQQSQENRKKTLKNSVSGRPLLNKNILASYTMSPIVR